MFSEKPLNRKGRPGERSCKEEARNLAKLMPVKPKEKSKRGFLTKLLSR